MYVCNFKIAVLRCNLVTQQCLTVMIKNRPGCSARGVRVHSRAGVWDKARLKPLEKLRDFLLVKLPVRKAYIASIFNKN